MDYRGKSDDELYEIEYALSMRENFNAAEEVADFRKYYNKKVEVIKGRKVPKGTIGEVFWLKRVNYSKYRDQLGICSQTRIGIRTELGETYFLNVNNVKLIN